jgi:hypothetical protein
MAELHIRFGANPGAAAEAPIQIEVITRDLDVVWSDVCPLGDIPVVPVDAGSYLVRGRLPSGEWMTAQATVADGGSDQVVLTPSHPSPHEHLAWGYYLKRPQMTSASRRRASDQAALHYYEPGPVEYEIWQHVARGPWAQLARGHVGRESDARVERLTAAEDPRGLGVIRVDLTALPPSPAGATSQIWLTLKSDWFATRSMALPMSGGSARVLLRFAGGAGLEDPLQVVVDTQHPVVEALLNMIATGDFGAARAIWSSAMGQAEQRFREKIADPFAAAVGGYFLLLAGDLERLHNWSANLDEWFPDMPDGAVIHAWHLMRNQGDVELARDRLIEAAFRGVPFYSCGLRLLVDGLDLFLQQPPQDSALAMARLRDAVGTMSGYAAAARWTEATTTVYGRSPMAPAPFDDTERADLRDIVHRERERIRAVLENVNRPAPRIEMLPDSVIIGGVRLQKRVP